MRLLIIIWDLICPSFFLGKLGTFWSFEITFIFQGNFYKMKVFCWKSYKVLTKFCLYMVCFPSHQNSLQFLYLPLTYSLSLSLSLSLTHTNKQTDFVSKLSPYSKLLSGQLIAAWTLTRAKALPGSNSTIYKASLSTLWLLHIGEFQLGHLRKDKS